MVLRFRLLLGAAGAGALTLALIGASNSAQINKAGRLFRPQPQATSIVGNTTGPLLYVENDGTAAFNAFGIIGAVGGGPDAIGVIGYGTNAAQGNIGTLGYDLAYVRAIPTPTGRKIRFVTNRKISFGEAYRNTPSQAYNLTGGEINIDDTDNKKSAGVLYPAAQLVINKEGDLQIELRKNPWKLNNIIVRGKVEK